MFDYYDDPKSPGLYMSPGRPGRFRFDAATRSMEPVSVHANADGEQRSAQTLDADRVVEQLPFGERVRLLVKLGLPELRRDQLDPLLKAIGDAPGEKKAFYAWAKSQGICDPESKESWTPYFEKFRKSAANAPTRGRIATGRRQAPVPLRRANGILDDLLSYMSLGAVNVTPGATTPAVNPLAAALGLGPSVPAAPVASVSNVFENQLVQVEGDPRVYVIQGGLKNWVNSEDVMKNRFGSQLVNGHWTGVNYITAQILAGFPDGQVITA